MGRKGHRFDDGSGYPERTDRPRIACRRSDSLLPRKEVIQPQLPLRLPCYDFVPVTSPTLGACLPERLAQRLQVLPASMT